MAQPVQRPVPLTLEEVARHEIIIAPDHAACAEEGPKFTSSAGASLLTEGDGASALHSQTIGDRNRKAAQRAKADQQVRRLKQCEREFHRRAKEFLIDWFPAFLSHVRCDDSVPADDLLDAMFRAADLTGPAQKSVDSARKSPNPSTRSRWDKLFHAHPLTATSQWNDFFRAFSLIDKNKYYDTKMTEDPETWDLAIICTVYMHVQSLHRHIAELEHNSKLKVKRVPQLFQEVKDKFRNELAHQSNTHTPMKTSSIDEKLDVLSSALRALYGHSACSCLYLEPKIEGILLNRTDLTYQEDARLGRGGFGVVYKGDTAVLAPVCPFQPLRCNHAGLTFGLRCKVCCAA